MNKPTSKKLSLEHEKLEKAYQESMAGSISGSVLAQSYADELTLIEQVRRKREQLSEKYNQQLHQLNEMERRLREDDPEELIGRIKDELRGMDFA